MTDPLAKLTFLIIRISLLIIETCVVQSGRMDGTGGDGSPKTA